AVCLPALRSQRRPLLHLQRRPHPPAQGRDLRGASWLTEFSLLAGGSTRSFGGMRPFVQTFTQNKLRDTLPQVLRRCGYRNVVFYPLLKNFVSNDRFYTSIGLKEIFDMAAQGAKSAQERDRFYFANALSEMERHLRVSRAPLFTYIQTMSAHW